MRANGRLTFPIVTGSRRHAYPMIWLIAVILAALPLGASQAGNSGKQAAWAIGHNLSLAALLYAQGATPAMVDKSLEKAREAAAALGLPIKPLPPPGASVSETSAAVIHYLIKGEGWSVGEALNKKFGAEYGILFEIAVKSNLGILLYQPGNDSGIGGVIQTRSQAIRLPSEVWMPVVTAINSKATPEEIKRAIFKFHSDVAALLAKQSDGAPATVGELLQSGGRQLTRQEITKSFAGATIDGTAMGTHDSKFRLHYTADGKAAGEGSSPLGSTKIVGTWSANGQDQYCQDLQTAAGTPIKGCFYYYEMAGHLFAAQTADKTAAVYERKLTRD